MSVMKTGTQEQDQEDLALVLTLRVIPDDQTSEHESPTDNMDNGIHSDFLITVTKLINKDKESM